MSAVSRVGFLRSGLTLAILKDAGIRPEVREELMRVVRNGRMSLETAWKREEGMGTRGQVVAWLDITSFREERGKVGAADRGGSGGREDSGRGERGADGLHLLSKVGDKVISCEGGSGWRGVRREENMENSFLGLQAEELILVR